MKPNKKQSIYLAKQTSKPDLIVMLKNVADYTVNWRQISVLNKSMTKATMFNSFSEAVLSMDVYDLYIAQKCITEFGEYLPQRFLDMLPKDVPQIKNQITIFHEEPNLEKWK
jgi:hypothetical protein